jgi:hypothetical protein
LSAVGARSAFYAVPLYLLRRLWLAAAVQTLLTSWTLWVAVRAFRWRQDRLAFLGTVVALTAATSLPFFSTFMMPDIFAGLAALAAGLLLFFSDRLPASNRWGLLVLMTYAVVAHTSNIALVAAAIPIGTILIALSTSMRVGIRRTAPLCGAFLAAVVILVLAAQGLKTVFGRPVQNPPFILGRMISDGPGLAYLEEHCKSAVFVSCELTSAHFRSNARTRLTALTPPDLRSIARIRHPESFIWPFIGSVPFTFSPRFDPDRRERWYAEQWEIVIGSIRRDPLGQAAASFRHAAKQLILFRSKPDVLSMGIGTLIRQGWHRAEAATSIIPNVGDCQVDSGSRCYRLFRDGMWNLLYVWHYAIVAISGFLLAYRLAPSFLSRERRRALEPEQTFALFTVLLVVTNAVICAVSSGPADRFQARVVWLIPLVALVVEWRCGSLKTLLKQGQHETRAKVLHWC